MPRGGGTATAPLLSTCKSAATISASNVTKYPTREAALADEGAATHCGEQTHGAGGRAHGTRRVCAGRERG